MREGAATNRPLIRQPAERVEGSSAAIDMRRTVCQTAADEHMAVAIKKSGISSLVSLPARDAADELRRWLKEHRCRLGPIFESSGEPTQYCFFVYTGRQAIAELAARNVRFRFRLIGDLKPRSDRLLETTNMPLIPNQPR